MSQIHGGNELIKADIIAIAGVEAGMRVADLGCGNLGYFAFMTAKAVGKNGVVYAVDILKSVLEAVENKARQEGFENVKVVWSNLEKVGATKIPAGSLDVAYIHNMLFQSTDDAAVLKEAYRLVKPGGKVLVIDWLKIATPFGPTIGERIDAEEAKKCGVGAGFKLLQEFEAGPYHYGLVFQK